jgi:hypothetical protein
LCLPEYRAGAYPALRAELRNTQRQSGKTPGRQSYGAGQWSSFDHTGPPANPLIHGPVLRAAKGWISIPSQRRRPISGTRGLEEKPLEYRGSLSANS